MKRSLPLMAALTAATLSTPAMAQDLDMSSFLNPGALMADLGLSGGAGAVVVPNAPARTLAAPILVAPAPAADLADLAERMEEVADASPAGANTTVILSRPAPRPSWFQRLFGL